MKTKYLSMLAALALVAACTAEKEPVQTADNTVTLVAQLAPRTATRVLDDPGDGTLSSAWTVGEEVWVSYNDTSNEPVETKATVTSVAPDGSAGITATLINPVSCEAGFGYPFSSYTLTEPKNIFTEQLGTLEDVSANYDCIFGSGEIVVNGSEATLPTGVEMEHKTCVWRLSFTDGSTDITPAITQLVVSDSGTDYVVSPSGQSTIYVSTYPMVNSDVTITATTASGDFSVTKSGITLAPGKVYTSKGVALASTASLDPIKKAEALPENTYSIQKTGEAAQVFPFQEEYSSWYVSTSYMDGTQQALHMELMDEDGEQTMGWLSAEFPPALVGELTTVDEDFCTKYSWSSVKTGTFRLGQDKMLDVHMGNGGNVKLDGSSQFLIKPKVTTKSYSGQYQLLFVFVFDNWIWDQETESYITGDEYTICCNATLNELIADLTYFSLNYESNWVVPGQSVTITANWTPGAQFDWSKVKLDSQSCGGRSGEWFTWDASTQKLYAKTSADNSQVELKFSYAGTDMTASVTLYNGPGYSSFSLSMENSSADFILTENDPAYGWGSDTVWLTVDEWAPEGSSFSGYGIEIDPATENYNKLYYNPYGKYVDFKKGIPVGDFNLIFRSVTDHSAKFTIPVKVVEHKAISFQITYKHSNGVFEPWTSGGENGTCNYPNGMELGVITNPEDAYWNWAHVELEPGYDLNFNYYGYGGKDDRAKLVPKTSHDSPILGTQVVFRLKWDNRKKSTIYVDQN